MGHLLADNIVHHRKLNYYYKAAVVQDYNIDVCCMNVDMYSQCWGHYMKLVANDLKMWMLQKSAERGSLYPKWKLLYQAYLNGLHLPVQLKLKVLKNLCLLFDSNQYYLHLYCKFPVKLLVLHQLDLIIDLYHFR